MTTFVQDIIFGAKSEFSVKRNLLEKVFAYTRGSVRFGHKIGKIQGTDISLDA
jgi:hypothetical protein